MTITSSALNNFSIFSDFSESKKEFPMLFHLQKKISMLFTKLEEIFECFSHRISFLQLFSIFSFSLVSLKATCYRKSLETFFTRIWFLSWMSSLWIPQATSFRRCLGTFFTIIWLLSWINSLMIPQVTSENVLGHSIQEYVLSSKDVLWWIFRYPAWGNVFGHSLQ